MADSTWRHVVEKALEQGKADPLVMPEWVTLALEQWLNATKDQPMKVSDLAAYVAAIVQRPITTYCNEETITPEEILSWMPGAVADAMGDLLADLKKGRGTENG